MIYHNPVLLKECVDGLNINSKKIYVDVTFGSGGHSREIFKKINSGRLISFDMDSDVKSNLIESDNFLFIHANYKHIKRFLRLHDIVKVDGILADLGVSSHQIDLIGRGFSFMADAELDMRMNTNSILTAKSVINEYSREKLEDIFFYNGDIKNSRILVRKIDEYRKIKSIESTLELVGIIKDLCPSKYLNKFLAKVFQSLRIEVNDEIGSLQKLLNDGISLLNPKGRFVVLTYHSIEDKLVKNFFKTGNKDGLLCKDIYGNVTKPMIEINKRVVTPSVSEIRVNSRSRSAKLRVAEKI
tara:strand:- start:5580 stop:6476 length:897 start_codon:yes stop_codon:yes gene_type:complete